MLFVSFNNLFLDFRHFCRFSKISHTTETMYDQCSSLLREDLCDLTRMFSETTTQLRKTKKPTYSFLSLRDFSLIFTADLKHVTTVFSKILPQNQLNSDTDLSVQRKPIFGSSLFRIASFDTIRRN